MADSDDYDSGGEDNEDPPSPSPNRSQKEPAELALAPRPLYHDREDVDWEDGIEDATPQTGTKISLTHPPPSLLDVSGKEEALNPPNPLSISNPEAHLKIMGRAREEPQKISKDLISTTGYPIGVGGTLVYDSMDLNTKRKATNPNGTEPYFKLVDDDDTTLQFESLFESANLFQAYRTGPFEYDLLLRNDFNTNGHTQWYYFSVQNTRQGENYRFNIINMYKKSSMYNRGLRPLMYSEKLATDKKVGWHRCGSDIIYVKNNFHYQKARTVHTYYSLSFTVTFPSQKDKVYLSHCYPYTYTDLQQYIVKLEADAEIRKICRRRLLCRTMAGNRCDLLTITAGNTVEVDTTREAAGKPRKQCVVLSARVHPGESNASWIIQGCIDFLVSNAPQAVALREQVVFKVVPMLNPDGVILGNYRTGLAGSDLNRKWKDPDQALHPTVYFMKQMMEKMRDERGVGMFVDLHGHSVKNNAFVYGCDARFWGQAPNHKSRKQPHEYESRIFPAQLDSLCSHFSLRDCRFHAKKKKEVSARVVCWRQITPLSYTLEASFGGADSTHAPATAHFGTKHYKRLGADLCIAIHDILCQDEDKMAEMRALLIAKLEAEPIPDDGDSDDEGDKEDKEESDDDSEDDTVDNLVLPQAVVQKLTTKPKKSKGRRASVVKSKKEPKKEEKPDLDRGDSGKSKAPLEKPTPPPIKKEPVKPPPIEPKPAPPPPEPEPAPVCTCPSCQVYEKFINGTIGKPPGRSTSGSSSGSRSGHGGAGADHGGPDDNAASAAVSRGNSDGAGPPENDAASDQDAGKGPGHAGSSSSSLAGPESRGSPGPAGSGEGTRMGMAGGQLKGDPPVPASLARGNSKEGSAQGSSGNILSQQVLRDRDLHAPSHYSLAQHSSSSSGPGVGQHNVPGSSADHHSGSVNYHPAVVAQQLLRSVTGAQSGSGGMGPDTRSSLGGGVMGSATDILRPGASGMPRSPKRLGGASAGPLGGVSRVTRKY